MTVGTECHNAQQDLCSKNPAFAVLLSIFGSQNYGGCYTFAVLFGLAHEQGGAVSLPITARQLRALKILQENYPDLGNLAAAIALAFDASKVDNPEMARLILEKTCRRIVTGQPGSCDVLIKHLERFSNLGCLTPHQVFDFTSKIKELT